VGILKCSILLFLQPTAHQSPYPFCRFFWVTEARISDIDWSITSVATFNPLPGSCLYTSTAICLECRLDPFFLLLLLAGRRLLIIFCLDVISSSRLDVKVLFVKVKRPAPRSENCVRWPTCFNELPGHVPERPHMSGRGSRPLGRRLLYFYPMYWGSSKETLLTLTLPSLTDQSDYSKLGPCSFKVLNPHIALTANQTCY